MWAQKSNKGPKKSRNIKGVATRKRAPANVKTKRLTKQQKEAAIPTEGWKSRKHRNRGPTNDSTAWLDLPGIEFIPWGKLATDKSLYKFTNTCPIDNTMMVLQILYSKYARVRTYFSETTDQIAIQLREIIQAVIAKRFNDAKAMWMQRVAKDNNYVLSRSNANSLWGAEDYRALDPIRSIFEGHFYEVLTCLNPVHAEYRMDVMNMASYVHATVNEAADKINKTSPTEHCTKDSACEAGFHRDVYADVGAVPPFLYIHLAGLGGKPSDRIDDIPTEIRLADEPFELVACNLETYERHFVLAIWESGQFLTYDGMQIQRKYKAGVPTYKSVTTAWYVRKESSS